MDGWIEHEGEFSPVEDAVKVETVDKDGWTTIAAAWLQEWKDVVKFRLAIPDQD